MKYKKINLQLLEEGNRGRHVDNRLDQAVGEGGELTVRFEPGAGSELLPQGLGSV